MSYEPFVRGVLTRLSSDLGAGRLSIRSEAGGRRYVVEAPGHGGRNIVVPATSEALKAPSSMPKRSPRGLLSIMTIRDAQGNCVNVPKSAIVRDHNLYSPTSVCSSGCRGCEFGTCPHGWKAKYLSPAEIIVLCLRDAMGEPAYGWYVRFWDRPNHLVRIPDAVITQINAMIQNPMMAQSSLLTRYRDCTDVITWPEDPRMSFHALACRRFARFRKRAASAALADRKRKRPREEEEKTGYDESQSPVESFETCVICLEERSTARKRCRHDSCGTHVCDTCDSDSRGLCPVCDRASISADFPCSSCHRLTRLSQYGFPCVGCHSHSLCSQCYNGYSACGVCETE